MHGSRLPNQLLGRGSPDSKIEGLEDSGDSISDISLGTNTPPQVSPEYQPSSNSSRNDSLLKAFKRCNQSPLPIYQLANAINHQLPFNNNNSNDIKSFETPDCSAIMTQDRAHPLLNIRPDVTLRTWIDQRYRLFGPSTGSRTDYPQEPSNCATPRRLHRPFSPSLS